MNHSHSTALPLTLNADPLPYNGIHVCTVVFEAMGILQKLMKCHGFCVDAGLVGTGAELKLWVSAICKQSDSS